MAIADPCAFLLPLFSEVAGVGVGGECPLQLKVMVFLWTDILF